MSNLARAIAIASRAHQGHEDKGGEPYILHPLRLMFALEGAAERIVAVLHDVVEDTEISLADLKAEGFSDEVVKAVDRLTRREAESYDQFISRVAGNPLAALVKIEDLKDNLNLARLAEFSEADAARVKRYLASLWKLQAAAFPSRSEVKA